MSLSGFIAGKLTLGKGEDNSRKAPAVKVAIGGIALSVAVMLLAIAIVTGFKNRIEEKIMGFDSQLTIMTTGRYYGSDGEQPLNESPALRGILNRFTQENPGAQWSGSIECGGILRTEGEFAGLMFRSLRGESERKFVESNLIAGEMPQGEENRRALVISATTARALGVEVADKVDAYFISGESVRPRKFEITGIFDSHFGEYDSRICYAPYPTLAQLEKLGEEQTMQIKISGLPTDRINECALRLQTSLSGAYARGEIAEPLTVSTVLSSGAMYFNWLNMLDTNVVVILILMGCVSGFMLISCVMILILQRVRMIGILKAMGATDGQIGAIFVRLGLRVTLIGMLAGNAVAAATVLAQQRWHLLPLDPEAYFLTYVPLEAQLWPWVLLNAGVLALSMGLMLIPTALVSRLSPVKSIAFE